MRTPRSSASPRDPGSGASARCGSLRWNSAICAELTGGKDGRGAFEQGAAFLRDVAAGACAPLPSSLRDDAVYVVVSYADVPAWVNWERVRVELLPRTDVSPDAAELAARSVFISTRDLEVAATVAHFERSAGRAVDLGTMVRAWRDVIRRGPTASDGSAHRLPGGLGDFMLEQFPAAAGHMLPLHREAWERAQAAVEEIAFAARVAEIS